MPKYRFIYTVSNGIFQMDVFTGMYILAADQPAALKSAARLNKCCHFKAAFETLPRPHISVNCISPRDGQDLEPEILKYQIQNNFDRARLLLGFPVFSDEDFENMTEKEFLQRFQEDYGDYLKHKNAVTFETVSCEVQEINNPERILVGRN
jgi:hypothetical protein